MYAYVCIYTCIYMHTYMHIYVCTYIYTYIYISISLYIDGEIWVPNLGPVQGGMAGMWVGGDGTIACAAWKSGCPEPGGLVVQ